MHQAEWDFLFFKSNRELSLAFLCRSHINNRLLDIRFFKDILIIILGGYRLYLIFEAIFLVEGHLCDFLLYLSTKQVFNVLGATKGVHHLELRSLLSWLPENDAVDEFACRTALVNHHLNAFYLLVVLVFLLQLKSPYLVPILAFDGKLHALLHIQVVLAGKLLIEKTLFLHDLAHVVQHGKVESSAATVCSLVDLPRIDETPEHNEQLGIIGGEERGISLHLLHYAALGREQAEGIISGIKGVYIMAAGCVSEEGAESGDDLRLSRGVGFNHHQNVGNTRVVAKEGALICKLYYKGVVS